ncbi:MAG TPA: hypothetical protein VM942_08325 [Acidimicrobiales bacterium]|nr:hypothetical protein [Acidimicrobiales bacterium]
MSGLSEVVGRVVDEGGEPAGDALVVIVAGSVPMPEIALLCGRDGHFSLRLPPGVFTLRATAQAGTGQVDVASPTTGSEALIVIR